MILSLAAASHVVAGAQTSPTGPPGPPVRPSYEAITGSERFNWLAKSTLGPQSLAAGVISAGWGTAFNKPEEYGPHWDGFGKRYGMRLTGVATSNTIEAGLGAVMGEDPRYVRSKSPELLHRIGHAAKMTFFAYDRDGDLRPAYARYAANVSSNFLSNTWRVESESSRSAATARIGLGFAGRFVGNVVQELWPGKRGR